MEGKCLIDNHCRRVRHRQLAYNTVRSFVELEPRRVSGNYLTLENLDVRTVNPNKDPACKDQTIGYFVGFNLIGSSSYNTIRNSKISGHTIGVHITDNSNHNKILNNEIYLNSVMNQLTPDSSPDLGAWGMDLKGDDNEIAHNYFHDNNGWCAYDFSVKPGNAIEIYNGDRNFIHHNKVVNDRVFSEVGHDGSHTSNDNIWAYNSFTSSTGTSRFLTLHGADNPFGPVLRSKVYDNSVYLPATNSTGIGGGEAGTLVKNNIIVAPGTITTVTSMVQGNNIFWSSDGSPNVKTMGVGDKKADPQFVNAASGDLHLKASSPTINAGVDTKIGVSTDFDGNAIPNGAFDIDAYKYGSGRGTNPTATPTGTQTTTTQPTPTAGLSPSRAPSVTVTPSITGGNCILQPAGDVNCDGKTDITDFEIWRKEYTGTLATKISDLDRDGSVSISDFEVWRGGSLKNDPCLPVWRGTDTLSV